MATTSAIVPDGFPSLDSLTELLEPWRGTTAFIVSMLDDKGQMLGNNGDRLMHAVFYRILEHLDIRTSSAHNDAQVVIVPPNGALLEMYKFPDLLKDRLRPFPNVPVVIFPSSAYFEKRSPAFMFTGRSAPTLWIFREAFSFAQIEGLWGEEIRSLGVDLALDHDVVASGHQFVGELVGHHRGSGYGSLIAARVDREALAVRSQPLADPEGTMEQLPARSRQLSARLSHLADLVPYGTVRTTLTRIVRRNRLQAAGSAMLASLPDGIRKEVTGKERHVDASATQYATFEEYLGWIASSDVVVTNRLHVALPAAILGKKVILVEAGYHKLEGVYKQSLERVQGVIFSKPTVF